MFAKWQSFEVRMEMMELTTSLHNFRRNFGRRGALVVVVALSLLTACSKDPAQPNVELLQDMMESPAYKAQEYQEDLPGKSTNLVPPENTEPQGFQRYAYATDIEGAVRELKNPVAGDTSPEVLLAGQKQYEIHCMLCHGQLGEGGNDLSIGQKMALKPPSLVTDKIKAWEDGRLYHTITMGQGLMGPYASHVPQSVRWQLVQYIRHLQK